jgi:hypothetical protein
MIFRREDTLWSVESVVTERSDKGIYEWERVTAVYSGFGPLPTSQSPRTFFYNKRQVKDFSGNPLPTPRYIN